MLNNSSTSRLAYRADKGRLHSNLKGKTGEFTACFLPAHKALNVGQRHVARNLARAQPKGLRRESLHHGSLRHSRGRQLQLHPGGTHCSHESNTTASCFRSSLSPSSQFRHCSHTCWPLLAHRGHSLFRAPDSTIASSLS